MKNMRMTYRRPHSSQSSHVTTTKKAARGTRWAPKKGTDESQSVLSAESATSGSEVPIGAGAVAVIGERCRQPGDDTTDGTAPHPVRRVHLLSAACGAGGLLGHVQTTVRLGRDLD